MEPRILIADDDHVLLDLMLRRIHRLGYQADRAENGGYALELLQSTNYDLIVTDIYMPGATGLDLLDHALKKDPKAVVLIITGGATIEKALLALDRGAYSYLTKPFDHLSVFDFTVKRALEYRGLIFGDASNTTAFEPGSSEGDSIVLNRAQLFDIVERYPGGLVVLDPEGGLLLCNPSAEDWVTDLWGGMESAIEELRSGNGNGGGSGRKVRVAGRTMRIRTDTFSIGVGNVCTLFAMDLCDDAPQHFYHRVDPSVGYLKKALAWMFNRKMTDQEFQVLRTMAHQVAKIDVNMKEMLDDDQTRVG